MSSFVEVTKNTENFEPEGGNGLPEAGPENDQNLDPTSQMPMGAHAKIAYAFRMLEAGVITKEEFDMLKTDALGTLQQKDKDASALPPAPSKTTAKVKTNSENSSQD